jgi:hypothetical protein
MSFKAPPAVRAKINDTILVETRNSFVIRCLVDRSEDVYVRVAAIVDIHRFVEAILASADLKILTESQIVIALLSMFVELTDELEFMSASLDNEDVLRRCQVAVKFQAAVVQVIGSCATNSAEARKTISRLIANIEPRESSNRIISAFTKLGTKAKPISESATSEVLYSEEASNIRDIEEGVTQKQAQATGLSSISPATGSSTTVSATGKSQWWGSWMSTKPVEPLAGDADVSSNADLKTNSSGAEELEAAPAADSTLNFLQWFNNPVQDRVRGEFRAQLAKDLPILERLGSKFNEKIMQKRSKYVKSVQDKVCKEKTSYQRTIKDVIDKVKVEADSATKKYHNDLQKYLATLQDALEKGRSEIDSSSTSQQELSDRIKKFPITQDNNLSREELSLLPIDLQSLFDSASESSK